MHQYGLTEAEKLTHLQQYNHALFQNSMSFIDLVWEINIPHATIVILEDKSAPHHSRTQFLYDEFFRDYVDNKVLLQDREAFGTHMSLDTLRELREEIIFPVHLLDEEGSPHLYRLVLTPSLGEDGHPLCIYVGGLNLREKEQQELAEYRGQELFREALTANCYFHFEFDVTAGGLIWGDFEARDGTHPIRDATGLMDPCPYSVWVDKWRELYEPQFDQRDAGLIFSNEFFKRSFARNERILDVEAKQKKQDGSGEIEYMHFYIILYQEPADQHIWACIIWRDISKIRSRGFESNLNLQTDNEELRRTVSREQQFQRAALSGALMVYNINLTRNLIEDEFYEIVDGTSYPMLALVGLSAPCSFDEFCQRWSQAKVPEESRDTFLRLYNRQYLLDAYARDEHQLEIEFDTAIGRGIPVTLRNVILLTQDPDSGDILAMVNAKDVTAQRKEERNKREALQAAYDAANRANTAKSDFLARMSHDIRTPMNAIIGMTAIAATHLDDPERVADCLSKITISSRHLLGLINEVLDMSKIESGKISLQEEAFVLSDLIEELLTMCRPQLKARDHQLEASIHDLENERVIGDSQHLQQVFMNLMSNAIKYTPNGGTIRLSITEKPTNRPRIGCYEFIFEDNGIGMSPEFQARIFDPFERAQDERALKEQGTGLGLAITKNIVQMMNGTIEVESELDRGTKFTVTIFLKLQDPDSDAKYQELAELPILVADDDPISCETVNHMLTELGMKSEWVLSGREAVDRVVDRHAADDDFCAVILDWKMPDMDGVSTAREIRRQVGEDVPIIILSAYDWSDIEQEARAAGVNAFISKPLFKSRMAYLLSELLGHTAEERHKDSLELLEQDDFSGHRALLAEDNELNAEIAQEIFGAVGLEVDWVLNGKEALDTIARAPDGYYDIIFMDIQMPIMNGYEAVKAIRSLGRAYTSTVPILAMSANAFAEDVQDAKAVGMNGHIAKPLDFALLEKALKKWLH